MERRIYKTEGRERLVQFLLQHPDRQFTAEELCAELNGSAEKGKSSVYRQLSALCREDAVRRFSSQERGCNVYQYVATERDCRNHFHAKCRLCGVIEHLACGDSSEFAEHLMDAHGFSIDCGQSVLYGVCRRCRDEKGGRNA